METPVIITTLVAASALIPALVGAAARAPRHLRAPLLRLRRPLVVMLLLVAGLRAPASAATAPPQDRLQVEDPDSASESGPILAETPSVRGYVVQPGDSLWAIACRTLEARTGDSATNEQVDRFWRLIYQANRDQVGADPDLIFAGQDLVLPEEV
jgi:hypothetical protein